MTEGVMVEVAALIRIVSLIRSFYVFLLIKQMIKVVQQVVAILL